MKRTLKAALYSLLSFIAFIMLYMLSAWLVPKFTVNNSYDSKAGDIDLFLLSNGVHTDIVMPIRSHYMDWNTFVSTDHTTGRDSGHRFVGMGWGDKGFYLETPTWADLKARVAFNAVSGFNSTAMHVTFYKDMSGFENIRHIRVSAAQYEKLVDFIKNTFDTHNNQLLLVATTAQYGPDDAFYEAKGRYHLFKTCNTWTNKALKISGIKAAIWTAFDWGIMDIYR